MKFWTVVFGTARTIFWIVMAVVLLAVGIILSLYSPWGQDAMRERLLARLNSVEGVDVKMETLRLLFPLRLSIGDILLTQNGDTVIAAKSINAKVALLPLLMGQVKIPNLSLRDAHYAMRNADSLMQLRITADTLDINPGHVGLSPLSINIDKGRIHGIEVSLMSKPDTAPKAATPPATELNINVKELDVSRLTYKMQLEPTIDSLGATIGNGKLQDGHIDLLRQTVKIKSFTGSHLSAAYIAPNDEELAAAPAEPVDTVKTEPWTVTIDNIHFTNSDGLYAIRGIEPLPGLDLEYIQASDMNLTVTDFYNQETTLRLPIKLTGTERCGVQLEATGTFAMDSTAMYFKNFEVHTEGTNLYADGMLGVGDLMTDPTLPFELKAHGNAAIPDLKLMFPEMKAMLSPINKDTPLDINLDVRGSMSDLDIAAMDFKLNHCISLSATGQVSDLMDTKKINGHLSLRGNIINVNSIVKAMGTGMPIEIPPMTLRGDVAMNHGNIRGSLNARTLGGELALKGGFNGNIDCYNVDLQTYEFPVNAFDKTIGVGHATLRLDAQGHGFDPFSPSTHLDLTADIMSVDYNDYDYKGIDLKMTLDSCMVDINASCHNSDLDATLQATGNLQGQEYEWTASIDAPTINLYNLKLTDMPACVACVADATATTSPDFSTIAAHLDIRGVDYDASDVHYSISDIDVNFMTCDSLTEMTLSNRDLLANASAPYCLDSISTKFGHVSEILAHQIEIRQIEPDTLQKILPHFSLYASGGTNNLINDILSVHHMGVRRIQIQADNDSSIDVKGRILGLTTESIRLDTIGIRVRQDNNKMQLRGTINNRPGTFDEFAHVNITGILDSNRAALRFQQHNIQDQAGFDIGAVATLSDTTVMARLFPISPIIGYKKWTVNLDNYIGYNFPQQHIEANLKMTNDKSSLAINSLPVESDSIGLNDIAVKLSDIHISDWIAINPFAPPITGDLSADMKVKWNGGEEINGDGTVTLADFTYNRQRVGTFVSTLDIETTMTGMIRAKGDLSIDSKKVIAISGALNDSTATSPLDLDFTIDRFPLSIANPFMPPATASMSGYLTGDMCISGDLKNPLINGDIDFESAAVKLAITGTDYKISEAKIPVKDNLVTFTNFGINGTNDNPLNINGTVDMGNIANPRINIGMKANNMMIVNTNSTPKGADIFGKGYINLDATAKGNMNFLSVNANLTVLAGTNVTYVLSDIMDGASTQNYSDMVKFVNFTDSLEALAADSISNSSMLMSIDANLVIQSGTTITVDLNTGSRDKVQIQPTANLTYTQTPASDGRMTGRVNISDGYARYTIPVIGQEKAFNIEDGSYIVFTGDILNPTLHINATDPVKTNVTTNNSSRLVNFDILVGITGTFESVDLQFDLTTNDDISISNELQAMSPDQRANQAMNLLLYGVYTGSGTGSINIGANPLYSFLESQVNNWAANNIKGIDLSFGIDQYNQTADGTTSTAMNYSYQMSKSLFNDRFKIVVGGNYNTDATNDENLAENLISDISFVYYLNNSRTMLIKIFRHTGYESILEGEITQTGVGFVYKRKINYLVQALPRFMRPKKYKKIR